MPRLLESLAHPLHPPVFANDTIARNIKNNKLIAIGNNEKINEAIPSSDCLVVFMLNGFLK